ncbi:VgrG-related protein [Deinococcus sp. HMF7620]|uniref:VgrG-related protein n=1 Tax=Deinococcus arboris TaxID=2682977 RepID=A0A7C9HPW5_9DEIO|nr:MULTISPECIES: VgrG-related protein [Deinococcus]MBZ9751572.1 VgrG-related protein [Deinococcus betulae]MVN85669.1 VgrG-related protein [Deinococcus arboris]
MTRTVRDPLEGSVSSLYMNVDGQDMSRDLFELIHEITVDSSLQLPDVATITLRDPEGVLVDDEKFRLGARIKIVSQVQDHKETVFDGELVEVEPRFVRATQQLRLRAFDRLHRLARGTHTRSFQNISDLDLVKKLAGEAGMTAKTEGSSVVHPYVLQHNQTNLAFLRERVSRLGLILYADGTTLHCQPVKGQDAIDLAWGDNLAEFLPRLTSMAQTSQSTVRSWDPKQKRSVVGQATSGQGKAEVSESTKSEGVAQQAFNMKAPATSSTLIVREQGYAAAIAQAQRNTVAEQLLEARGVTAGYPRLTAGTTLNIKNVGKRFSGKYVASNVRHIYRNGEGYSTEFSVTGSRPDSLGSLLRAAGTGGSGGGDAPYTPVQGLMIGIVTNNNDPENQGRVKLKLPALTEEDESDWARVVGLGNGSNRGSQTLPEVNDEVLVGFEHGDIHHPYVIGGLWNGKDAPPRPSSKAVKNGKVIQRVYRTRLGHEFIYEDPDDPEPPKITLQSSKKHALELNDDKKKPFVELRSKDGHRLTLTEGSAPQVILRDKNGNEVLLNTRSNTVTIKSTGKLELKATTGISIDAGGGNVDVRGVMINLN